MKFSSSTGSGPGTSARGPGASFRIDKERSGRVVRESADRVEQLSDAVGAARPDDAPGAVSALVAGAVVAFFEERREKLGGIRERGTAVTEAADQALAAYAAGEQEMVAQVQASAARAGQWSAGRSVGGAP